jgi:two-component system, OmpR family, response regulator ChvI
MTYRRGDDDDDDELSFSNEPIDCCVSIVDMVGSTRIIANIGASHKIGKYYSIFINNISAIRKKFGAVISKFAGDSLVLYFPQTSNRNDKRAFKNVIECGITMLAAFNFVNSKMSEEGLPSVSYRISSDYGRSDIARLHGSNTYDLFGPAVNICTEINRVATPNTMVIGDNLCQIIKSFPSFLEDYLCKLVEGHSGGDLKRAYPVYSVASKYTQLRQDQLMNNAGSINKSKGEVSLIRKSNRSGNILLVDDDSDILLTYKSFLEIEGYNAVTFGDPESALKHFAQAESSYYDLVLLDIRMPRLNGLQLFYRMKSINMNTKFIFVSALDAAEELLSMLPGIELDKHIIKKPVGKELFLERMNTMISED